MKILVISDIHANIDCLNAIWEREKDADDIFCAGDLVDYGPFPCEVVEWAVEHKIKCVMGNHDRIILDMAKTDYPRIDEPMPEDGFGWKHINCGLLKKEHLDYLSSLPMWLDCKADGIQYTIGHSIRSDYIIPDTAFLFDKYLNLYSKADSSDEGKPRRMILGHIHKQFYFSLGGGREWLNPGSASYHRYDDPSKKACYAIICDGKIELKQIDYDRSRVQDVLEHYRNVFNGFEAERSTFYFCKSEEDGPMTVL